MRALILAALLALPLAAQAQSADQFGRTITVNGNTYTVTDPKDGASFSVQAPTAAQALATINAMQPSWYQPPTAPNPTTITSGAFFNRFTAAEQAAVQQTAQTNIQIGVGLTHGLAVGQITLTDPTLKAWMDALVAAGAITAARETAILTP